MAELLLSPNFVSSPLHLKKKKKKYRFQYLSLPLGDPSSLEKLIHSSFLFLPAHFFQILQFIVLRPPCLFNQILVTDMLVVPVEGDH